MTIDIESLVVPLGDEAPAGPDLDEAYDEAYQEFERLVDQQEWTAAREQGEALFARTRDLRIGVNFSRILLELDGINGFAAGVSVIRHMVEDLWSSVHPEMDFEVPPMRTNVLMGLSVVVGSQSVNPIHDRLRRTSFVSAKTVGSYSYRDYQLATGELELPASVDDAEAEAVEQPTTSLINAAVQEADREDLLATAAALASIATDVELIEGIFLDKMGAAAGLDLSSLSQIAKAIRAVLVELGGLEAGDAHADDGQELGGTDGPVERVTSGEINSRQDAIVALEKVSKYFQTHEPTSPVPLLLARAKRLVSMDFMEVLRDMVPDAIHEAERITGASSDDE